MTTLLHHLVQEPLSTVTKATPFSPAREVSARVLSAR